MKRKWDQWAEDGSRCFKEGYMYGYEIQTCMFLEVLYGLGIAIGIKEDSYLTFGSSSVCYLGKKIATLEGFMVNHQRRARFPLKQEGEGNNHSRH